MKDKWWNAYNPMIHEPSKFFQGAQHRQARRDAHVCIKCGRGYQESCFKKSNVRKTCRPKVSAVNWICWLYHLTHSHLSHVTELLKSPQNPQASMAFKHTCNPSFLRNLGQENHKLKACQSSKVSSRPALAIEGKNYIYLFCGWG